jgi:DNA-directed RNA polymerase sigma subunit (sigma70/sigma32)
VKRTTEERDRLVMENGGLVWSIVLSAGLKGPDADDAASVGMIALIEAAETFDASRSAKFSAHAGQAVRRAVWLHRMTDGVVRIPRQAAEASSRAAKGLPMDRRQAAMARDAAPAIAFRAGGWDDDGANLLAPQRDRNRPEMVAAVGRLMGSLDHRRADPVRRVFGLDGFAPEPVERVAASHGVSGASIRERIRRAIEHMARHAKRSGITWEDVA